MRIPRHTRNVKRILYAPITIIVLMVLLVVLVRAAVGAYLTELRNREGAANIERDTQDLRSREQFLSDEIERLQSSRGVEEELRNKFPVVKEGESMVIIVEPEAENGVSPSNRSGGFWRWLRGLFE